MDNSAFIFAELERGNCDEDAGIARIDDKALRATSSVAHNSTLLIQAAYWERPRVVQALLDKGADVNARDDLQATALIYAAVYENQGIMEMLINKGANINASDHCKRTPLYGAISSGSPSVVQLLLDKGADIDAKTDAGQDADALAKELGNKKIMRLLKKERTRRAFKKAAEKGTPKKRHIHRPAGPR
ncbi:MAG: ankyrin repeat domain-containing protein [Alphaproteobacteria bacterium]|nr:ankyrin repeat domain-containing protein [Alphaproteobacteria bacterium]